MKALPKPRIFFYSQDKYRHVMAKIALLTVFILILLPFWSIFQDILTRVVMSLGWYRKLQNVIVPYELRIVATVLTALRFPILAGNAYLGWIRPDGKTEAVYLIWNCVGWQTLVLFLLTLLTGLSGRHTWSSKFEALVFGILGTYLINIGRLVLVILVYMIVGRTIGQVFHDYFSNILTLAWLFSFWWFSYKFVLVEKINYDKYTTHI